MISIGSQSCRRPIIRQSDSVANSVRWCQIAKETRARESQSKERISAKKLISKSFLAWGSRNRAGYHISYSLLGADSSETILVTTQSDVWIRKATSGRDFRERLRRMIQKTLESNFEKQTLSCAGNSKCVQVAHYKLWVESFDAYVATSASKWRLNYNCVEIRSCRLLWSVESEVNFWKSTNSANVRAVNLNCKLCNHYSPPHGLFATQSDWCTQLAQIEKSWK